jgi:beta-glucosidase
MRPKVNLVPGGVWGGLETGKRLNAEQIEEKAKSLLAEMTLEEKIGQMSGDTPLVRGLIEMIYAYNTRPLPAGENHRLGIPGIRFSDGPRGVVMYRSTCFPVSMARGASWDVELEDRIGDAIGIEARTQGANFFGGVCINLLRHPGWGRAQETYGEDPFLLGEMGAALVRGVQRHIMACAKHYAVNSIENTRFKVDVNVDERTLREVYLPHFKRCVDDGVASIMSAYNKVNGRYCGHNTHLLRDILKNDWQFDGFVISDFFLGIRGATAAAAGLDIEMPFTFRFGRWLRRAVKKRKVSETAIDDAALRILRQKLRFAGIGEPERYNQDAVAGPAHQTLAREAAQKSIVLLQNHPVGNGRSPLLPVRRKHTKHIALIGALGNTPNIGDGGSSRVRPPDVVTPLEGLRAACGSAVEISFADGSQIDRAVHLAAQSDITIVAVGYTHKHEGEYIPRGITHIGGDRFDLRLPANDEAMIEAVASANPRTVVVMFGGSAIITESWRKKVPAILMAWYAGMEGGHALADILFGNVNPSAKLPCTFPKSENQLPFFDPRAKSIQYDYLHGYWLLDHHGDDAAFPFGFGLSYTTYQYSDLTISPTVIRGEEAVDIRVRVTNIGDRAGEEVVQLYAGYERTSVCRPKKKLKGFQKIFLQPGEGKEVFFRLPPLDLAYYDTEAGQWVVEPGKCRIFVGSSSRGRDLLVEDCEIAAK